MKEIDELINIYSKNREYISPNNIPWEAIRVTISQSVYGSKIDNEYDMKILESLVNLYFNEKTFSLNYPLFKTSSENQVNVLMIPEKSNSEEYLEWINSLPEIETPEWISLPNYAVKLIRDSDSNSFINGINKIQDIEEKKLLINSEEKMNKEIGLLSCKRKEKNLWKIYLISYL